jgi:hypothetical protein
LSGRTDWLQSPGKIQRRLPFLIFRVRVRSRRNQLLCRINGRILHQRSISLIVPDIHIAPSSISAFTTFSS